jgi:hypothetical protein
MVIIAAGLLVAAAGFALFALTGPGTPDTAVLRGGGLIPPGLIIAAAGVAWPWVQRWARREVLRQEAGVLAPAIAKLRALLGAPARDCTVDRLVRRTGLPTAEVVRALRWMRDTGEVDEELDLGTGEFYYGMAEGRGLDARYDTITRGRDA